jgi:hypothetical protein
MLARWKGHLPLTSHPSIHHWSIHTDSASVQSSFRHPYSYIVQQSTQPIIHPSERQYYQYNTFNTIQYIQYNTFNTIHSIPYIQYNTFNTIHSIQYIQYNTFNTIHSIQYIQYNTFNEEFSQTYLGFHKCMKTRENILHLFYKMIFFFKSKKHGICKQTQLQ